MQIRMRMSTSNSKHGSCLFLQQKYLPKRESTHADVKSCPSNETRECSSMCNIYNTRSKLLCYITCWQLFSYLLDRTFITSWSISYNYWFCEFNVVIVIPLLVYKNNTIYWTTNLFRKAITTYIDLLRLIKESNIRYKNSNRLNQQLILVFTTDCIVVIKSSHMCGASVFYVVVIWQFKRN